MLREGYLFRMDKVSLFLWLMGELIGAAFFLFTASRIASRELGLGNAKPAVAAFSVLLGCALFFEHSGGYGAVEQVRSWLVHHGWLLLLPCLFAGAMGGLLGRSKGKKEKDHANL